jgi:hypothetical protein
MGPHRCPGVPRRLRALPARPCFPAGRGPRVWRPPRIPCLGRRGHLSAAQSQRVFPRSVWHHGRWRRCCTPPGARSCLGGRRRSRVLKSMVSVPQPWVRRFCLHLCHKHRWLPGGCPSASCVGVGLFAGRSAGVLYYATVPLSRCAVSGGGPSCGGVGDGAAARAQRLPGVTRAVAEVQDRVREGVARRWQPIETLHQILTRDSSFLVFGSARLKANARGPFSAAR